MDVTSADAGTTKAVRVGEPITVRLPENPTTGYRWEPAVDPAALEVRDDRYDGATRPIGAGGERVLTFAAVRPGRARLELVRRRSWEREPVETFALDLDVSEG